jgi:mycothiol synthase
MSVEMPTYRIELPDAPVIAGLTFRACRSEADYAHVADVMNACREADGIDTVATRDEIASRFSHLANFVPAKDLIFAEMDGQPIGYTRLWFRKLDDDKWVYTNTGSVLPAWRRRGIGRALQHYGERRLREKAGEHGHTGKRVFQSLAMDTETSRHALLLREGYQAVRYGYEMERSLADPIPDLPLPAGIEVRPVRPEQYEQLRKAMNEAFSDHWGWSPMTEQNFQGWRNNRTFQPQLWQVAWAGDEIVGTVLNFIDAESNAKFQRRRGWTETICVRRPWRKQGVAKALIARSMRLLQEQGMIEVALNVDTQNPTGALQLYESMGYRAVRELITYEKPLD